MMICSMHRKWFVAALAQLVLVANVHAQAVADDGRELLASSGCTGCHGSEGLGTALAPSIVGSALSEEAFRDSVRNARGAMPAYSQEVISNAALSSLYAYTRSRQGADMPVGNSDRGAQLYERVGCYSCHSNQGQGIMHGPRIGPDPIRWGRFLWYVRYPSGQMPPYSAAVLSAQDLADLHVFLQNRPRPQPVESIPLLAP